MMSSSRPVFLSVCLAVAILSCRGRAAPAPDPMAAPPPPALPPPAAIPEAEQIRVTVVNNRADGGAVTVYVEPSGGTRTAMGTVDAGTTRTFPYRVLGTNRTIKLFAMNAAGAQTESEVVTVPVGSQLNWDLLLNSVRIRSR